MCLQTMLVFRSALLLALAGFLVMRVSGRAGPKEKDPAGTTLYHRDRDHLWNRVHSALLMRTGPDGRSYGEDRLEPLLWMDSDHLLGGASARRAVAVLNEFVRSKGETLIDDPLKRAMLQRDLWLVFNWLARKPDDEARKQLGTLLAQVIRRLALTGEQIARLPDNYAAAVASKRYAKRFDPENPERSYLSPELFNPKGLWVSVGRTDGPTAPFHLDERGTNRFTNSAFLIFLKLPAGRDATLDFLKRLAAFDRPLLISNTEEKSSRLSPYLPNPAMPQWPKGTEVALLRRALLIDSARRVVASPLTESVQWRVMRTGTVDLTPQVLEKASLRGTTSWQASAEFRLRRAGLFAGHVRGLHDVSGERDFKTGFNSHPWDEFGDPPSPATTGRRFPEGRQPFASIRASCGSCHNFPGIYSFHSLREFAFGGPWTVQVSDGEKRKTPPLAALPVAKVERAAVEWKKEQPGWKALRKLMAE
jgi:hypothetical protein